MTREQFNKIKKNYRDAEKRFQIALEEFDQEHAKSKMKLSKVQDHLHTAQREYNQAKIELEEQKMKDYIPKKTVSDIAYGLYNQNDQEQERNRIAKDLFETLIPEVGYSMDENPNLTLEEACEEVINDSGWETFHYTIFVHLTDQQYPGGEQAPDWRSFIEDFEEFMSSEAPKMLKKAYIKENPTGWVAAS